MIPALDYSKLESECGKRYAKYESRVTGIILAPYTHPYIKDLVDKFYQHWDINTNKDFDLFWAGYGAYLQETEEKDEKIILNFSNNRKRVYYDAEAFRSITEKVYANLDKNNQNNMQIVLTNCVYGDLNFDNVIILELKREHHGYDEEIIRIDEIIRRITQQCRSANNIDQVRDEIRKYEFSGWIKDLKISDVFTAASSVITIITCKI